MYEWNDESQSYEVHVNYLASEIAQKLDFEEGEFDEQVGWRFLQECCQSS